jgi:uncharacterized protein YoxC
MDFLALWETALAYISIWLPAITATVGILVTVIGSVSKMHAAIQEVKETKDFSTLKDQVAMQQTQLEELTKTNQLLVDQLAKCNGYTTAKLKEDAARRGK